MKFGSGIALCAVVVGLSGLTLCQPPRPRIAGVEVRGDEVVAPTGSTAKDILVAFDRTEEAIQTRALEDLLARYVSRQR